MGGEIQFKLQNSIWRKVPELKKQCCCLASCVQSWLYHLHPSPLVPSPVIYLLDSLSSPIQLAEVGPFFGLNIRLYPVGSRIQSPSDLAELFHRSHFGPEPNRPSDPQKTASQYIWTTACKVCSSTCQLGSFLSNDGKSLSIWILRVQAYCSSTPCSNLLTCSQLWNFKRGRRSVRALRTSALLLFASAMEVTEVLRTKGLSAGSRPAWRFEGKNGKQKFLNIHGQ